MGFGMGFGPKIGYHPKRYGISYPPIGFLVYILRNNFLYSKNRRF